MLVQLAERQHVLLHLSWPDDSSVDSLLWPRKVF
jgi:hypothetical protein